MSMPNISLMFRSLHGKRDFHSFVQTSVLFVAALYDEALNLHWKIFKARRIEESEKRGPGWATPAKMHR